LTGRDWDPIARDLVAMAREDLRVRTELAADGSLFDGYHPRMQEVHDRHAARLAAVLDQQEWPGEPQVGREAAEAAWLIVQHAIAQPAFQRRALGALASAAARGEVPAWQPAMLEDRIRVLEGRPQRYGTQLDWDRDGRLSPLPLEDPANVEGLRRSVGLGPLEEAVLAGRRAAASESERPPADWSDREKRMEDWLRSVGWRS
jgi:hypothetical protein